DAGPLLPHEDQELAGLLIALFAEEGIALKPSVGVQRIERRGSGIAVVTANGEQIIGSHLLIATGRRADTAALNLDAAGIETTPHGIKVDARLRT
ncbi:MAG: dihydrolipoamide dehydrogenase, partial [Alphaproteobacteria bacterium]